MVKIKDFIENLDDYIYLENHYKQLAIDYIITIYKSRFEKTNLQGNIFTMTDSNNDYQSITKKGLLLPNTFCISYFGNNKTKLAERKYSDLLQTNYQETTNVYLNDFEKLGRWIEDSRELILSDKVIFIPYLERCVKSCGNPNFSSEKNEPEKIEPEKIWDINMLSTNGSKYQDLVEPLINLSIPVIENINYCDFVNVYLDNQYVEAFKNFLTRELSKIKNPSSINELRALELELNHKLIEIEKQYKSIMNKYFKQTVSVVATTIILTASLYILNENIYKEIASVLSTGGVIGNIYNYMKTIFNADDMQIIKSNDCYFLWVLKQNCQ